MDFRYNLDRDTFSMSIRYNTSRVADDATLNSFLQDRLSIRQQNHQAPIGNLGTPYSATIKEDAEFLRGDVQFSVIRDYNNEESNISCKVVETDDDAFPVGLEELFPVEEVHRLILEYLVSFNNVIDNSNN